MDNILQKIESIEINPSIYGEGIEDRFKVIDSNFDRIIKTDYLIGKSGNNTGVTVCLIDDEQEYDIYWPNGKKITPKYLSIAISDAIKSIIENYEEGDPRLNQIGEIGWDGNINGSKVVLYHEVIDGKKIIASSLPYIYIDPRFSNISSTLKENYENLLDVSGVIYYDPKEEKFVHIQSFPTIYYDENIGDGNFCWNINGKKTGIICQGPQGEKGLSTGPQKSSIYIHKNSGDSNEYIFEYDTVIINDTSNDGGELELKFFNNDGPEYKIKDGYNFNILWKGDVENSKIKLSLPKLVTGITSGGAITHSVCNIYCLNNGNNYNGDIYLIGDGSIVEGQNKNWYNFVLTYVGKIDNNQYSTIGIPTWWLSY